MTFSSLLRILLLALGLAPALVGPAERAGGQESLRIAAVVNDEVISVYDLAARIDIAVTASRLRDGPALRRQLAPQILRSLVDERLKMQEAERLALTVGEAELASAMRLIEERNGITPGGLGAFLESQGLDDSAVEDQMRAEIVWSKLVRHRFGASVSVGEDEIDAAVARLEGNRGRPEYRIAEIFLAIESPDREGAVRTAAERLHDQLAGGASFARIARQFSQSATAAVGGDVGWVVEGRLPSEIDAVLADMEPGAISRPIRAFDGYYIVSLIDRRTVLSPDPLDDRVRLAQLVVTPDRAEALQADGALARLQEIDGCDALLARARAIGTGESGDLGQVVLRELPADIRTVANVLPVGRASAPLPHEGGLRVLMVCERDKAQAGRPDRDAVRQDIAGRRMEMLARRYLRDLRRAAFVDIRL